MCQYTVFCVLNPEEKAACCGLTVFASNGPYKIKFEIDRYGNPFRRDHNVMISEHGF